MTDDVRGLPHLSDLHQREQAAATSKALTVSGLFRRQFESAAGSARCWRQREIKVGAEWLGRLTGVVGGFRSSPRLALRALAFALVILFGTSGDAHASGEARNACPVCDVPEVSSLYDACDVVSTVDIDLCVHDAYESRYRSRLRSCGSCNYVVPRESFTAPLGPSELDAVKTLLARHSRAIHVGAGVAGEVALTEWRHRIELALEICRVTGSDALRRWTILRDAAWAERCEGARLVAEAARAGSLAVEWERCEQEGLATAAAIQMARPGFCGTPRLLLDALERRIYEDVSASSELQRVRRLFAAWLARRHGENSDAIRLLSMIEGREGEPIEVYRRTLERSIRAEREWQQQLANMESPADAGGATRWAGIPEFQRAEALRRLDRDAEARPHYLTAAERGLPLAQFECARTHLKGVPPARAAAVDRAIEAEIASMVSALQSETGANPEYEGSWRVRPDLLVPRILERLRSDDTRERVRVVRRLRDIEPMSQDVARALALCALSDRERRVRLLAVRAVARGPADVVRRPLEALLSSEDLDVRERAAAVLGGTGDEHSVALLLDAGDRIGESVVTQAVGQIANRQFEGREECASWWASSGSMSRRSDWVVSGFRQLGLIWPEQEAIGSVACQIRAIELLDDDRFVVRANALRLLREGSGLCDPWPSVGRGEDAADDVWHAIRRTWRAYVLRQW